MFTSLTFFYIALIVIPSGFLVLTSALGGVLNFGEHVADAIGGIGDNIDNAFDSITDHLDGIFGGADAADMDIDVGGVETPEINHGAEGSTSPSPFSFRTILVFVIGFGVGGLVGKGSGMSDLLSLAPASGGGLVLSIPAWFVMRAVYSSQGSTSIQATDYIGLVSRVSTSIPGNGLGEIVVTVKGEMGKIPALSENNLEIPSNSQVVIISMEGGKAIVREM